MTTSISKLSISFLFNEAIYEHTTKYLLVSVSLNHMDTCFDQTFGHLQASTLHKK
jgi:hypothetical protein